MRTESGYLDACVCARITRAFILSCGHQPAPFQVSQAKAAIEKYDGIDMGMGATLELKAL